MNKTESPPLMNSECHSRQLTQQLQHRTRSGGWGGGTQCYRGSDWDGQGGLEVASKLHFKRPKGPRQLKEGREVENSQPGEELGRDS